MARLDAVQSLVSFVEDIKPYHTKVVEVLVEYIYNEDVNVTITEDFKITVIKTEEAVACPDAFGTQQYGVLTNGYQRVNPYYDPTSPYYVPQLDMSSESFDPSYVTSSPTPTGRELAASLTFLIFNVITNANPYYDPSDPDYNPAIDINASPFDPMAYDTSPSPTLAEMTVSIPYVLPSEQLEPMTVLIDNPFYDPTNVEYDLTLDSTNSPYLPDQSPIPSLEVQAVSVDTLTVNGNPLNPFYDPTSGYYNAALDRNSATYDPSLLESSPPPSVNERAASFVYLPFVEGTIQSNWDNSVCAPEESRLAVSIEDELNVSVTSSSSFMGDYHLTYDVKGAFQYSNKTLSSSPASPAQFISNGTATQIGYGESPPDLIVVAKVNVAIPTSGRWYWEFVVEYDPVTSPATLFRFGIMPAGDYNLPYGPINNNDQHLGNIVNHYGLQSDGDVVYSTSTSTPSSLTITSGDVVGVRYDADAGTLAFYINDILHYSGVVSNVIEFSPAISVDANNAGVSVSVLSNETDFVYSLPALHAAIGDL